MSRRFLAVEELAERHRTTSAAVYSRRHKGGGPPGIRVGKALLFAEADVEAWEDARRDEAPVATGAPVTALVADPATARKQGPRGNDT